MQLAAETSASFFSTTSDLPSSDDLLTAFARWLPEARAAIRRNPSNADRYLEQLEKLIMRRCLSVENVNSLSSSCGLAQRQVGREIGVFDASLGSHVAVSLERRGPFLSRSHLSLAKEKIRGNLDGNISIAEIARLCGLSRGYFITAFRETTGETPHRWITGQRVERARELLLRSKLSLANVALTCGFADQSHFTRVFSRIVGSSPGAWRRAARL